MRRLLCVAFLAVQCAVAAQAADRFDARCEQSSELPSVIPEESRAPSGGAWISARALESADTTETDLAAAPPSVQDLWLQAKKDGHHPTVETVGDSDCSEFLAAVTHLTDDSAVALDAPNRRVAKGTVKQVEQGFFKSTPGSLLLVELDDNADPAPGSYRNEALVFVVASRLRVGAQTYCAGHAPPSPGDRILVVTAAESLGQVIVADPQHILNESRTRGIYGSARLRSLAPGARSVEEVWQSLPPPHQVER